MNGVESTGSAGFTNRVPPVTGTENGRPTSNQEWKRVGMEGAMKLSGDFIKEVMMEVGFVDIHASSTDKIEAFVRHTSQQEQGVEVSLDPVAAAEMAALTGAQLQQDANLALRILARVDPARAAALLK